MTLYKLYDQSFMPDNASRSDWYVSDVWTKDGPDTPVTFHTDWTLEAAPPRGDGIRRVAVLLEPPEIFRSVYDLVESRRDLFDRVATHQRDLAARDPARYFWYPYGTTWIHDPADRRMHPKTRGVSLVASGKRTAVGHQLRHALVAALRDVPDVDVCGRGYRPVATKAEATAPFRFTVVVENSRAPGYFTEKLLDAFVTGTAPIYWGDPAVGACFDLRGIVVAETLDELVAATRRAADPVEGPAWYAELHPYLAENFVRARRYLAPDAWLVERLGGLLP